MLMVTQSHKLVSISFLLLLVDSTSICLVWVSDTYPVKLPLMMRKFNIDGSNNGSNNINRHGNTKSLSYSDTNSNIDIHTTTSH